MEKSFAKPQLLFSDSIPEWGIVVLPRFFPLQATATCNPSKPLKGTSLLASPQRTWNKK